MNLALFDFDGTISNKDSFKSFLQMVNGNNLSYFIKYYIFCLDGMLKYRLGIINAEELKTLRIKNCISKMDNEKFILYEKYFYTNIISKILRQEALDKIKWHKSQNDEICIVSASYEFCLSLWCESNNVELITNKINRKTGEFILPDCNGEEKVRRIKKKYDLRNYKFIYSYGDTMLDVPMLELANYKYYKPFRR